MKRRKFLIGTANVAFSTAYIYGLQSLMETCFGLNQALAQTEDEINYLNIQMPGAPPRWYFDQPLNPFNKSGDFTAGLYGTEIRKVGGKFQPIHIGKKMMFGGQQVYMPPVWNLKSASSGKAFKELLEHTMMIRGVDMEINSHTVNRERVVRPVASQPSITGLVADKSNLPLSASGQMGTRATSAFKSEKGSSVISVNKGNPIPNLIDSFKGRVTKAEDLDIAVTQVMESLDDYAKERGLSSQGGEGQQMSAYEMFDKNLDSFNKKYVGIYKKYQAIVRKEIRAAFPGVTTVNPISDESVLFSVNRGPVFVKGALNNSIDSKTHINATAQAFAFAEFALTEKLSSSVTVDASGSVMQSVKGVGNVPCDQHFVGGVASVFYTSLYYRAFLGCLMELKVKLEAAGIFDKTLIHIMTEFSRTPKKDGSGADHGFNGSSVTLIGGMIETPGLVGNIRKKTVSNDNNRYPGTWGEAAPFNFSTGRRPIVNDDIVNTVCEIVGVKKIAVKGQSLIRKSGEKVSWIKKWEVRNV